jgi:hypothetical protein
MAAPKKSEWKPKFLEQLREHANVSKAAREAVVTRQMAYHERQGHKALELWDDAIEEGVDNAEEEAYRRAVHGVEKPVHYQGERVDKIQEFSDTLLIFLLKGRRSQIYGDKKKLVGPDEGPIQVIEVIDEVEDEAEGEDLDDDEGFPEPDYAP